MITEALELVHLEVAEGVATITLDSPHNRNALSRQLVTELTAHVETADADDAARVILVRSAHRVFCAGADLAEAAAAGTAGSDGWNGTSALVVLLRRIVVADKPVVVELGGPVVAGGLGIVGAADVVVASDEVTFQLTEVLLGVAPAIISLTLLPRLAPRAASELFLRARKIMADEAVRIGLVTAAVPAAELGAAVGSVCADIARAVPQGLRETKRLLNRDLVAGIDARGTELADLSESLFRSEAAQAAIMRFFASRGAN
jgi:enoyl-CoA hydratase/methylglutaconyl-CoA hydratase